MSGELINPEALPPPSGFSYAVRSTGQRTVHFAGHTAVGADGAIVGEGDLVAQFERVLANLAATAAAARVELEQLAKLTLYVIDIEVYRANSAEIGALYRRTFGAHYPAMTLVQVQRLWDPRALIEIDGVAVL